MQAIVTWSQIVVLVLLVGIAAVIDARSRRIPNWVPISLFAFWVLFIIISIIFSNLGMVASLPIDILVNCGIQALTAAVVAVLMAGSSVLCKKFGGVESPLGMGDIKLMIAVSLFLGPTLTAATLIFACALFLIFVLIRGYITSTRDRTAPFAPFVLAGICVSILLSFVM